MVSLYFIYKYKQRNIEKRSKNMLCNVRVMRNVTLDHTGNNDPSVIRPDPASHRYIFGLHKWFLSLNERCKRKS